MKIEQKLLTCLLLSLILTLALSFALVFAQSETLSSTDYKIIKDSTGAYAGTNIKLSTEGELVFAPVGDGTVATSQNIMVSYNFDSINKTTSDGLLIYFDRGMSSNTVAGWILLGNASNSTYYRAYVDDNMWINPSGSIRSLANNAIGSTFRYNLPTRIVGTLFIPWSSIKNMSGSEIANTPNIGSLHYVFSSTTATQVNSARSLSIASISTIKLDNENLDNSVVNLLVDTTKLSYTNDASNTTSDVNLADLSKGTKVSVSKMISGTSVSAIDSEHLSKISATRTDITLRVNYVDENGETLMDSTSQTLSINNNVYTYNITAPSINGYVFNQSKSDALIGSINNSGEIDLVYDKVPAPILTVKYLDEEGNEIKSSTSPTVSYNEETKEYDYEIQSEYIFAYKFVKADADLVGGITADTTIKLTYAKNNTDNFDVIKDDEQNFAGVDLNLSVHGLLNFVGDGGTAATNRTGITFNVGSIKPDQSKGLLVYIDRSSASGAMNISFLIELSDGTLFRASIDGCKFVTTSGNVGTIGGSGINFNFGKTNGTLYIPWSSMTKAKGSTTTLDNAVVNNVIMLLNTDNSAYLQTTRPTAIGSIALVNHDDSYENFVVEKLLNTAELTYSINVEDTTSDVNLANITEGKKVSARVYTSALALVTDDTTTLTKLNYTRTDLLLKINFVDRNLNAIKENGENKVESINVPFSSSTGKFTYNYVAPSIENYEIDIENSDKLTDDITENTVINLVYNLLADFSGVKLKAINVCLDGKIAMAFYYELPTQIIEDENAYIKFTVGDTESNVYVKDVLETLDSSNRYKFVCKVAAAQMTLKIKAVLVDGNGCSDKAREYSVKDYADYMLANGTTEQVELVKAMLNYGAFAQTFFDVDKENLANEGLFAENPVDSVENITKSSTISGEATGFSLISYNLFLESETTMKIYFNAEDIEKLDIKVNGQVAEVEQDADRYAIIVRNISAALLDEDFIVSVVNTDDGTTYSLTTCALCCAKSAINNSDNENLVKLMKALYLYNTASNNYFGK